MYGGSRFTPPEETGGVTPQEKSVVDVEVDDYIGSNTKSGDVLGGDRKGYTGKPTPTDYECPSCSRQSIILVLDEPVCRECHWSRGDTA